MTELELQLSQLDKRIASKQSEEARLRVPARRRLGDHCGDVPPVLARDPELLQPVLEPGVADRRRAHVDPAPPGAEIERGADDGRLPLLSIRHGP